MGWPGPCTALPTRWAPPAPICLSVRPSAGCCPHPVPVLRLPRPQEVLLWLTNLQKELGQEVSDEKLRDFIWNTLNSGRVSRALRGARGRGRAGAAR